MRLGSAWLASLALLSGVSTATPLPVRNQNPLLAGTLMPAALPSRLPENSRWTGDAQMHWSSTALIQQQGGERLVIDAETREFDVLLGRTLGERFALQLTLPWRQTTGGSLDGFIDDWHGAFGLPDGDRGQLPRDALQISYRRNGQVLLDESSVDTAFGDATMQAGYQLQRADKHDLALWLSVQLPTGSERAFTGNDALDAALSVSRTQRFGARWTLATQLNAMYVGHGGPLEDLRRHWLASGTAALNARVGERIELTAQIDAHTAAFRDSSLDFLGEAVIATLGGSIHFHPGWELYLAVSEDVLVETSPDVVFLFGLRTAAER